MHSLIINEARKYMANYDKKQSLKEFALKHKLKEEEFENIIEYLGKLPNDLEIAIFSAMWNEHCSYKSTKIHLAKLPTQAEHVICGPGENAGIIDIGDQDAIIFKMESHNHPSFIEPFQGAATGVGGILRDIFTMGARPIALLNSVRYGEFNHPNTKKLLQGTISGISWYGNSVGVPTVGGECEFHKSYNNNNLVNAMAVGLVKHDKIFYSNAGQVGSSVMYVGKATGRDGICGATMASNEFDHDTKSSKPTVQVGDPFAEKLLIEACLELMQYDIIIGIQDMGAAGLTCSSVEMTSKAQAGIEIDLHLVPTREINMTPYELMLSETQERMLITVNPGDEDKVKMVFDKWGLSCTKIGQITDTEHLTLNMHDKQVGNIPISILTEKAPCYDRKYDLSSYYNDTKRSSNISIPDSDINSDLCQLLSSANLCSKHSIWQQYDRYVMNDTISASGESEAAIIKIRDSQNKAIAITADCTPRYCLANPIIGGMIAVAESYRNLICVGSTPKAITNCLNFGNPEKIEIMSQLVGCLEGMTKACNRLSYPVVSGNVSLYNETLSEGIAPTPTIGGVGLIDDINNIIPNKCPLPNLTILLVGNTTCSLYGSIYAEEILHNDDLLSATPNMDLEEEYNNASFVKTIIQEKKISACKDLSNGGLYIALAKMFISTNYGCNINIPEQYHLQEYLFCEDQSRYLLMCNTQDVSHIIQYAQKNNIMITQLGKTHDQPNISVNNLYKIEIKTLTKAYNRDLL